MIFTVIFNNSNRYCFAGNMGVNKKIFYFVMFLTTLKIVYLIVQGRISLTFGLIQAYMFTFIQYIMWLSSSFLLVLQWALFIGSISRFPARFCITLVIFTYVIMTGLVTDVYLFDLKEYIHHEVIVQAPVIEIEEQELLTGKKEIPANEEPTKKEVFGCLLGLAVVILICVSVMGALSGK